MTPPRTHRKRFWLQFGVSLAVVALLLALVDLDDVRRAAHRFDWRYAPWFAAFTGVLIAAFAFRWYVLLGRRVSFGKALYSTTVGLGGNMVLPARGGDVVRVVYTARDPRAGAHLSVSTLFLEKVIDLLFVAAIGLIAISLEATQERAQAARVAALVTGLTVLIFAATSLWLAKHGALIPLVRQCFRLARIGPSIYRHAFGPLNQLARAVRARTLAFPLLLTSILWCGLYPFGYVLIGEMVGIPLGYTESLDPGFRRRVGPCAPSRAVGPWYLSRIHPVGLCAPREGGHRRPLTRNRDSRSVLHWTSSAGGGGLYPGSALATSACFSKTGLMRTYLYSLLARYLSLYVRPEDAAVDLDPLTSDLRTHMPGCKESRTTDAGATRYDPLDADYVDPQWHASL